MFNLSREILLSELYQGIGVLASISSNNLFRCRLKVMGSFFFWVCFEIVLNRLGSVEKKTCVAVYWCIVIMHCTEEYCPWSQHWMNLDVNAVVVWPMLIVCSPHRANDVSLIAALEELWFQYFKVVPLIMNRHTLKSFSEWLLGWFNCRNVFALYRETIGGRCIQCVTVQKEGKKWNGDIMCHWTECFLKSHELILRTISALLLMWTHQLRSLSTITPRFLISLHAVRCSRLRREHAFCSRVFFSRLIQLELLPF